MTWGNNWTADAVKSANTPWPKPTNIWDALTQDQLLTLHLELKNQLIEVKAKELELRKYIVDRAFPEKHEGTNTLELGQGYELKANVKFNYRLADNETVERTLARIAAIGNKGSFIADRLVSWSPSFLLTEYRELQAEAEKGSQEAKEILKLTNEMLTIEDAAPALDIKAPKVKK
jgi:hypothetical protein